MVLGTVYRTDPYHDLIKRRPNNINWSSQRTLAFDMTGVDGYSQNLTSLITSGAGTGQRIGNKIIVKRIMVEGSFTAGDEAVIQGARILVVQRLSKDTSGTPLLYKDVIDYTYDPPESAYINGLKNMSQNASTRILWDSGPIALIGGTTDANEVQLLNQGLSTIGIIDATIGNNPSSGNISFTTTGGVATGSISNTVPWIGTGTPAGAAAWTLTQTPLTGSENVNVTIPGTTTSYGSGYLRFLKPNPTDLNIEYATNGGIANTSTTIHSKQYFKTSFDCYLKVSYDTNTGNTWPLNGSIYIIAMTEWAVDLQPAKLQLNTRLFYENATFQ